MYSRQALKVAFSNKYKRWVPVTEKEKVDSNVAMNRFKSESYFFVNNKPKFSIKPGSSIFTIGSCFARNVETALHNAGLQVIGYDFSIDSSYLHESVGALNNKVSNRSLLNKYSVHSMFSELDRVINRKKLKDYGFIEVGEGRWVDPQLAAVVKPTSFDELLELRMKVDKLILKSLDADVIFITLGLTEVWYDCETDSYLNSSPPPILMRNDQSRFKFVSATFSEIKQSIEGIVKLLSLNSTKIPKFVLTVSPVPLSTTWTSDDVIVANTHSKSTLRVAAKELANESELVDYFPSYEFVLNSPRELAWQEDELHVQKEMVNFIIDNFKSRYVGDSE